METRTHNEEDFNDEQLIALLRDAEQRLRTKQSNALQRNNPGQVQTKHGHLKAQNLPKPYVDTRSGIAKVDRSRIRKEEDRKLAAQVKKVEDPVLLKERKLKVRYLAFCNLSDPRS